MRKIADTIENATNGKPLQGATITLNLGTVDALIPQAIYTANDISSASVSSVTSDADGYYEFYAPDGTYIFKAAYGDTFKIVADFEVFDESEQRATIAALPILASGLFTPTIDQTGNTAAVAQGVAMYLRIGNVVHVSGYATIDPVLNATATGFNISLPIASTLVAGEDCAGVCSCATVNQSGFISADPTHAAARANFVSTDLSPQSMAYTFSYKIL